MSFSILSKVLKNGTRYVVSKRGNNTVIQRFWADGCLAETKVKNIVRQNVGNKKVITKNEFLHEGHPEFCTGAKRRTTDRVYDSDGKLLGIRKIIKEDADTCEHILHKKIENIKNSNTYNKQFLTPEGNIAKEVHVENGIKQYTTYLPSYQKGDFCNLGYTVSSYPNGIMIKEMSGLDVLF